jgi:hypothetical protein
LNKIDHRLRALWERTPERERARQRIRVLIRFAGPARVLDSLGVQIHSVAGDIASAELTLGDVPRIAGAAEVIFVELSHGLAQDR